MEYTFENGIKIVYKKSNSKLTSISIGLQAGADIEEDLYGLAHATEHMLYKGTKKRSEEELNKDISKIFGFNNAMTNFPYAIYYGTLLEEDFHKGVEILADILINPSLGEKGFKEEMKIIIQELNEWDEDLDKYTEDKAFYNTFDGRLKYPIIGRIQDLKRITIEDIRDFYKRYYVPNNVCIAIVSSLPFDEAMKAVYKYFGEWKRKEIKMPKRYKEEIKNNIYTDYKVGINSSRILFMFSLKNVDYDELKAFKIFNEFFGEGINSILFDTLRTKLALVYDVSTYICYEEGIKLYKIAFNMPKDKTDEAINAVNKILEDIEKYQELLSEVKIKELSKSIRLKKLIDQEKGVFSAKELSYNNIMFKDNKGNANICEGLDFIKADEIIKSAKKVFEKRTIQIITPKEG